MGYLLGWQRLDPQSNGSSSFENILVSESFSKSFSSKNFQYLENFLVDKKRSYAKKFEISETKSWKSWKSWGGLEDELFSNNISSSKRIFFILPKYTLSYYTTLYYNIL